jgi:hypothetical protein
MVSKGLLANIGAHGEPPLGLNYHAEMGFTGQGGLSNYEVRQPYRLRLRGILFMDFARFYVQLHRQELAR